MVNLVGANFKPVGHGVKPPDAYTKPPTVTITSPENYTLYDMNWVSLIFNVSVGESTTASYTWIHELWYKGDWQENKTYVDLEVYYSDGETLATPRERNSTLLPEFSFNLTDIPQGEHNITVYANEKGQYYSQIWHYWNFFINSSETVYFSIAQEAEPVFLGLSLPLEYGYAFISGTLVATAITVYLFLKRLRRPKKATVIGEGD
ncbi:MAG: hypothetical protein JSW14_00585 [Candidatus Bathyarchaeum sp.]|nr:MAG: hypothetical protein JSW14_00585 [Candidatus Bathyarchaeum sp.]